MFVKICGITNKKDALLAVESGADAIGYVFAGSKRKISPETAAQISAQLPRRVEKVGVFLNADIDEILRIAEIANLSCLQLHGNEKQALCDALGQAYKVIKTIKITPEGKIITPQITNVWKLLLDTHLPQASGGTGRTFDWACLGQFDSSEILVAGGLNAGNIDQLLNQARPFGVDVSSGVEALPGQKDPVKLRQFFARVNARSSCH